MKPSVGANSDGCIIFNVDEEEEKAQAHATEQLGSQDEIMV